MPKQQKAEANPEIYQFKTEADFWLAMEDLRALNRANEVTADDIRLKRAIAFEVQFKEALKGI